MARGTLTLAAVAALFVGANAGAVDLTQDNFDAKVFGEGKAAFIKFLAPWWCVRGERRSADLKKSGAGGGGRGGGDEGRGERQGRARGKWRRARSGCWVRGPAAIAVSRAARRCAARAGHAPAWAGGALGC